MKPDLDKYSNHQPKRHCWAGFTLVELAIVLVVVSLLLVALLGPLSAQQEQKAIMDTKRQLDEAKEALFGFLIANGRLPCPADPSLSNSAVNSGQERAGGCASAANEIGVLPWRTLGLKEQDAWGHRFTYRVSSQFANAATPVSLTSPPGVSVGNIMVLPKAGAPVATAIVGPPEAVAVLVSHGRRADGAWDAAGNKSADSSDADEAENSNGNTTFVDHGNTATQPNDPYDDLLVWVPRNLVFNKLIASGRLP